MNYLTAMKSGKIMAIDPSTNSLAFAVMEYGTLLAWGKIDLPKGTIIKKLGTINRMVPVILDTYIPDYFVIEQSIYIQNANTTRTLAYINGCVLSQVVQHGTKHIDDVKPLVWKPGIGYKNVSAKEKQIWKDQLGAKEAQKKASFERKERIKRIIDEKIPGHNCNDNDIIDAIGIGLWATQNLLQVKSMQKPYQDRALMYELYVKRRMTMTQIHKFLEEKYGYDGSSQTIYNWLKRFDLLKYRGKGIKSISNQMKPTLSPMAEEAKRIRREQKKRMKQRAQGK